MLLQLFALLLSTPTTSLDLGDGGTFARWSQRRCGLVRLSGRPVEGHHPEMRLGFVVGGKDDTVAFLDGVEEKSTAVQI